MAAATTASLALLADHVPGVGTIDDISIPFFFGLLTSLINITLRKYPNVKNLIPLKGIPSKESGSKEPNSEDHFPKEEIYL